VEVWGEEDHYNLGFEHAPQLQKLASKALSTNDTVFVLCLAGLDAPTAYAKVAEATGGITTVHGITDIKLASDPRPQAKKISSAVRSLRACLVKEAAVMNSAQTVDAVLGIGFLNSENVLHFMARLPYLEQAMSMVGELLFASRLGLSSIPEGASARAFRALDEVVTGLRALALRDNAAETEA
jgi:hypothetical protein